MSKKTLDEILAVVEKAREEWADQFFNEQTISNTVYSKLDKLLNTAIYTFLGLDHRFGEFTVDHCNGRKTILSRQVEAQIEKHLPNLLEKHAHIFEQKMGKAELEALRKEYIHGVKYHLREEIQRRARADAGKVLDQMLAQEQEKTEFLVNCQLGGDELAEEGSK